MKDIGTVENASFTANPRQLVEIEDLLYFVAWDPEDGDELWRSDGTTAGTWLLKDLDPGPGTVSSTIPTNLMEFRGRLFFSAQRSLWESDGTVEGTRSVKVFDSAAAAPSQLTAVNESLFFHKPGSGLWKSDGTAGGTVLVRALSGGLFGFTHSEGVLFFFVRAADTVEFWRSDGTADGTIKVSLVCPSRCSGLSEPPAVLGGTLVFAGKDDVNGGELWRSDGTEAGTAMVGDLLPGPFGSDPYDLVSVGSAVFFSAIDSDGVRSLWRSDGSESGTWRVTAVAASGISNVYGRCFFVGTDAISGSEPWLSDGTEEGTRLVRDICPGLCSSLAPATQPVPSFAPFDGRAFFSATEGYPIDPGLWFSDSTEEGTSVLAKLSGGVTELTPGRLRLHFAEGQELWNTDGTEQGTHQITEVVGHGNGDPRELTAVNNAVFFNGDSPDPSRKRALWRSDATEAATTVVQHLDNRYPLAHLSGGLIYQASHALWHVNGAGTETRLLRPDGVSEGIAVVGGVAFFSGSGDTLWRTDGTVEGTVLVKDLSPTNVRRSVGQLTPGKRLLFFTVDSDRELWRSDGTPEGTRLLHSGSVKGLTNADATVFFSDETTLWKSDGTVEGTVAVKAGLSARSLFAVGSAIFFLADDASGVGTELWTSDGTAEGTTLVKDIRAGPWTAFPNGVVKFGRADVYGTFYFVADDGIHGEELWKSDGTSEGTVLVKDILPGPASSAISDITHVYGKVLFAASDGESGRELWESSGTEASTFLLQDINPGPGSSNPALFTPAGTNVFFRASDGETGAELWALPAPSPAVALLVSPTPGANLKATTATFRWDPGQDASEYWLTIQNLRTGSVLYSRSEGLGQTRTVSGLPADGSTFLVRLSSRLPGGWKAIDSYYLASARELARMQSPTPGSTLPSSRATFTWDPGYLVSAYWLQVGTSLGRNDVYRGSSITTRSVTVTGIPANGTFVHVRLWSLVGSAWLYHDYVYRTLDRLTRPAEMITPAPSSVLPGPTVTFTWDEGSVVTAYWLEVGTSPGGTQISRGSRAISLSEVVTGIPTNGAPIYVRLSSEIFGVWSSRSYTYTARSSVVLSASAATVAPGQPVQVTVQGSPGNPRDWVGLYRSDAPDSTYLDWQYLNGTRVPPATGVRSATLTFMMPTVPGTYEFRLFENNGFSRRATSQTITVQ